MSDAKRVLVLAGNYRQFLEWCKENQRSPYDRHIRYVNSVEVLQGAKPGSVDVVRTGEWYRGPLYTGQNARSLERQYITDLLELLEGYDAQR